MSFLRSLHHGQYLHSQQEQRQVILLRHFSEMPFGQIAELLGCPVGTVLARAHRGLKRLREFLGHEP